MNEVRMPKPGDAILEAVLTKALVGDGEPILEGQPLYILETDKVEMQIDAPWTGTVHWHAQVGECYPVGALLATIE